MTIEELQLKVSVDMADYKRQLAELKKDISADVKVNTTTNSSSTGSTGGNATGAIALSGSIQQSVNAINMSPLDKQIVKIDDGIDKLLNDIISIDPAVKETFNDDELKGFQIAMDSINDTVNTLADKARKANEEIHKVTDASQEMAQAEEKVSNNVPTSSKEGKSFLGDLIKWSVIIELVKKGLEKLAEAAKEGLENAYQFSKAVGGDIAATMDNIATKTQTLKNSLGSAFGQILVTLEPILTTLISWLTVAANAVARFFALIGGKSTYLKATNVFKEWRDDMEAGAGAAAEWKNQLMGFDEINRLNGAGGGGGGTVGGLDFADMFEEMSVLKEATALELAINDIFFDWEDLDTDDVLRKLTTLLTTICGGVIGFSVGGVAGAAIGATLGLALDIGLTTLSFSDTKAGDFFNEWLSDQGIIKHISTLFFKIKTAFLEIKQWFKFTLPTWGKEIWQGVFDFVWTNGIKAAFDDIVSLFNSSVGMIEEIVASIRDLFSLIPVINLGGASGVSGAHINGYATGGFPEDGLFFANSGEMVGRFTNGKTAVANNEQIVAGISEGVYSAVVSAMNKGNSGNVSVYLDGQIIAESVSKRQRQSQIAMGVMR